MTSHAAETTRLLAVQGRLGFQMKTRKLTAIKTLQISRSFYTSRVETHETSKLEKDTNILNHKKVTYCRIYI